LYEPERGDCKSSYALDRSSYLVLSVSHWKIHVPIMEGPSIPAYNCLRSCLYLEVLERIPRRWSSKSMWKAMVPVINHIVMITLQALAFCNDAA
jgi:hypothetical protein